LREVKEECGYDAEIVDVLPGIYKSGLSSNAYFVMRHLGHQQAFDWETWGTRWVSFAGGYMISGGGNGSDVDSDSLLLASGGLLALADAMAQTELPGNIGKPWWQKDLIRLWNAQLAAKAGGWLGLFVETFNAATDDSLSNESKLGRIMVNLLIFAIIEYVSSAVMLAALATGAIGWILIGIIIAVAISLLMAMVASLINNTYFTARSNSRSYLC
jgi:hypothetical protein